MVGFGLLEGPVPKRLRACALSEFFPPRSPTHASRRYLVLLYMHVSNQP